MDWVHCNICYIQPGELPKRQFNLTSCGHIFCAYCEKSGEIIECKVCKNKCTTTQLAADMPQEVQAYFEDPDIIAGKLVKVVDFQRNHRLRLSEMRKMWGIKYQKAKVELARLADENRALKRKLAWYTHNYGSRTPENQIPKTGPPLLPQNSQASQAIRAGVNNNYFYDQQQQFRTPSTAQDSRFSGYRYNIQGTTPGTPSDKSNSPASVLSDRLTPQSQRLTPQSQPYHHSQSRSHYRAGVTPPMSNLKLLSIASQKSRDGKPF